MSQNRGRRGGQQKKGRGPNKGNKNTRGGKSNKNRKRSGQKKGRKSAVDPKRPFWEVEAAETEVRSIVDQVRPAEDPSALVRSLGSPPLGKYADNAQHYYAAVYEKAQRFAVAMAAANGVLVLDGTDDDGTGDALAEALVEVAEAVDEDSAAD